MENSNLTILLISIAVVGAIALVALLAFTLAYSILSRSMTHKLQVALNELEDAIEEQSHARQSSNSCVPPIRIHLEFAENDFRIFGSRGALAEHWFRGNDFRFVGQFVIEEMQNEKLRVFSHRDLPVLAVLRFPESEPLPYIEFSMLAGELELVGVANPPRTTLQLPEGAPGAYFYEDLSIDLLERMWDQTQQIVQEIGPLPVPQNQVGFAELYEEAHAGEMDYRLERGGLSEHEIVDTFRQQGLTASPTDIDAIQQQWQEAIELHLLDFSSHASNCHYSGRKVLIVHAGSQQGYLLTRLGLLLSRMDAVSPAQREQLITSFSELAVLLERFTPREAVARFRALLPKELRYDLVDQLKIPFEADCYVMPTS